MRSCLLSWTRWLSIPRSMRPAVTDYANTNNCGNKMALMFLLKHAFDVYSSTLVEDEDTYFPDDGYILATNESVGTLVKKILPDAEVVDQINTYALAL